MQLEMSEGKSQTRNAAKLHANASQDQSCLVPHSKIVRDKSHEMRYNSLEKYLQSQSIGSIEN